METPRRLTIGLLLDNHLYTGLYPTTFFSSIIRGAQVAARDQGVNLLAACGILHGTASNRFRPAWPDPNADVDFIPIGPWNTDGFLVVSPILAEKRIQYIRALQEKQFPVLFIGSGSGSPAIMVDNEGGIRQVLEHLVGHGHREIAFIAGDPQDSGDSLSRLEAYRRGVRDFNLGDDPRLVEYGFHWSEEGFHAMKRMLQSGVKFTAVMCSNDSSSLGVVRALNEAGIQIPSDIAVTGFDDQPEALIQIPPLTSVHYPLFETGYRALLLIRKRIEGGPQALPETVRVSTRLITRQSCGCFPEIVCSAAINDIDLIRNSEQDPARLKEKLVQGMVEALQMESAPVNTDEKLQLCNQLVESFLLSLHDGDVATFRKALIQILQRIERSDDDAHAWQAAISVLHLGLRATRRKEMDILQEDRGEDLLHQARTLLSESTWRRYVRLQLLQAFHDETMGHLAAKLLSSLDEAQIYVTLAEDLPKLGVRSCQVAFFEKRDGDPFAGSVIYPQGGSQPGLKFESRHFPPPGLYPDGEPFNLALLPLFFQEENLGYAAFDGDDLRPLAMVVLQLASAINSAQLHNKVRDLSLTDGLTGVYNRRYFEILLHKEVERSQRYNRDLAVVMIDIDRFKDYNDQFGHPAGDEALRAVSHCITSGARRGLDVVTRYGGDEFAVILPETDREGARIVAENIQGQVRSETRLLRKLTISLGIASLHGDRLHAQEVVEQSDRALYQAKHQGRDRAVIYKDWMLEAAHLEAQENKAVDPPLPNALSPE
ncbi:MAG: GGDEF domain-containing protein [Anaerolineales bacterium]